MHDLRPTGHATEQGVPSILLKDVFGKSHECLVNIMVGNSGSDPVQVSGRHHALSVQYASTTTEALAGRFLPAAAFVKACEEGPSRRGGDEWAVLTFGERSMP